MKIKTRLILSVAIFVIALLIIIGSVIVTNQQVDRLNQQEELAKTIEIEANELGYLSSDYILYRESQQAERWESKYSALASDLSDLAVDTPEQKVLVDNLMENQQRLRHVFDDIKSGVIGSQQGDPSTDIAVVQVSWSRLAVQTQGIVFDAGRLSHLLRDEADQVKQISNLLIFLLMGTFSLFILTSYLIVFRRTLTSIAELQDGVKVIGSGDLGHVIPEKGDDEIRDLSRAFNQMTVDLKGVTASKGELEREVAERRKAEEALRESESVLRSFFDSSGVFRGIVEVVAEDDVRHIADNNAIAAFRGLTPETMRNKTGSELGEPREVLRTYVSHYIESQRSGKPVTFEYQDKWGDIVAWLQTTVSYLGTSPQGQPRFAYVILDITERKRAEEELLRRNEDLNAAYEEITATQEELQQSNDELIKSELELRKTSEYLENLLDYANAPIIVWDPAFRITRFNHAFERLTGRKTSDVIGKHLEFLFPEKYAGTAMDIIRRTNRGERLEVVEIPILHVNGTFRTILWNSATLFEADGKTVLSTIAQGSDITERKRAEEELLRRNEDLNAAYEEITATQEELQQSNDELIKSEQELRKTSQYLENLIDYANAPIVVWDPHFVITRFNRAFEELTGRTAREIIGQRLEVLFPQRYLDASMAIIRKTMKGERLKVVEIPILNRRGEIRIVLWNSATLFEADGTTVQSTIAQGNDITERKMTEAELEERNEELNSAIEELTRQGHELNEALNEKEVLLSEVHHRVKNNLTAFISLLSLESAYDDTPVGLALKKDLQNRARSMALIHETLYRTKKYSRVNMDVYLSTLVEQVVSSYESGKSIQTGVETHGITLDLSRATPGGLIINELLTNSLKYAFPPSFDCEKIRGAPCMITVSLIEDDGAYILIVGDNGIGLPRNFDLATTKTLGLKLVNFLARHQLRASIEVHSDNGAEFRFRFQDKV